MMNEPEPAQHDAAQPETTTQPETATQPVTTVPRIAPAFDAAGRPLRSAGSPGIGGTVPMNPYVMWNPTPPPKRQYKVDRGDAIMALVLVVLGFLWWNWFSPKFSPASSSGLFPAIYLPGVAVTIFFALAVACSLIYFWRRQVLVTVPAIVGAVVIMAAALPYALYDTSPVHIVAGLGLLLGYITWHAYVAGTGIARPIGDLTIVDALNQCFVVPFSNLGAWFSSLRTLGRGSKKSLHWLFAVIGVIIALPIIAGVLALLMSSDAHFSSWMTGLGTAFTHINVWHFLWQFSLGVLVAIYMAGLLYGNAKRDGTATFTSEKVAKAAAGARRVTAVAIVAPVTILCVIYVVFFAATGATLFAAFTAHGGQFDYADYARGGFFQLILVATINLVVLGVARLFVQRNDGAYPRAMRALGAITSVLTLLLVVTAMSKLVLYADHFGLTRLRLYTIWFTGVLFVVFVLVGVWHVHRFNVGRPILIFSVVAFLALQWANTEGIIADYNVNRYLNGSVHTIDVDYLSRSLSAAAVPALVDLRDNATDPAVSGQAASALNRLAANHTDAQPWTSWNWQWSRATHLVH